MADISSNGTGGGLASATASWSGGVVPVEGDKVTIVAGDVIELDGVYTWGDGSTSTSLGSSAINNYGTIKASRTVSSALTCFGLLIQDNSTGLVDFGVEGDEIPQAYTANLIVNKRTSAGYGYAVYYGTIRFAGAAKTVNAEILVNIAAGVTTAQMTAVPVNWNAGESVLFLTTTDGTINQEEVLVIDSVSGDTVTFTSSFTYDHKAGSPASNLSSNVKSMPYDADGPGNFIYTDSIAINTLFEDFAPSNSWGVFFRVYNSASGNPVQCDSCAFTRTVPSTQGSVISESYAIIKNSVFYRMYPGNYTVRDSGGKYDDCVFACSVYQSGYDTMFTDCWLHGGTDGYTQHSCNAYGTFIRCTLSGAWREVHNGNQGYGTFIDCDLGSTFGYKGNYSDDFALSCFGGLVDIFNCTLANSLRDFVHESVAFSYPALKARYFAKDNDVEDNETWTNIGRYSTNKTTIKRSATSIAFTGYDETESYGVDVSESVEISCNDGESIRVIGYCQADSTFYNSGDWIAPTVTISGLGITPVVFTASSSADGAWEKFDLTATNDVAGYPGKLTLTFNISRKGVGNSGYVYFDGVPFDYFVTKCRHYGFIIDEVNPVRKVDNLAVADEATAIALTGCMITDAAKTISFSTGTISDFQNLYDYTMAFVCANLDVEIPFTRAGSLFSITEGWTIIEPVYDNTWDGGTVQWDTVGSKTGGFSDNVFDFTTAGDYNFGSATFSGTVELVNTSGGNVTVALPSGTSYTNTGPNITVTVVANTFSFTVNPSITGYEWRIYNVTAAGSLAGSSEQDGEETATTDNQSYAFNAAATIAVQIIAQPDHAYVESVTYYELGSDNINVNINLEVEENL